MRVVGLTALLLTWDANAYRLPHRAWKSEEGGEGVGDAKYVGDESVKAATDGADENSGTFRGQRDELENADGTTVPAGEVLGAVIKERDYEKEAELDKKEAELDKKEAELDNETSEDYKYKKFKEYYDDNYYLYNGDNREKRKAAEAHFYGKYGFKFFFNDAKKKGKKDADAAAKALKNLKKARKRVKNGHDYTHEEAAKYVVGWKEDDRKY